MRDQNRWQNIGRFLRWRLLEREAQCTRLAGPGIAAVVPGQIHRAGTERWQEDSRMARVNTRWCPPVTGWRRCCSHVHASHRVDSGS